MDFTVREYDFIHPQLSVSAFFYSIKNCRMKESSWLVMNKYGTHEHIFPSLFYFLKAFYMEEV